MASRDPYWHDSGEWPPFRKQLKGIEDPVAEERFTYRDADGKRVTSRVVIGRPSPAPKDFGEEWYCPVIIEGWTAGVDPVLSTGPIGALVNAGLLVRAFLHEHVFPAPSERKGNQGKGRKRSRAASGKRARSTKALSTKPAQGGKGRPRT